MSSDGAGSTPSRRGLLFIVSAASTSAALMMLIATRRGWDLPGVAALHRMDDWVIVIEMPRACIVAGVMEP